MIAFAAADLVVHSDIFGVVLAGVAIAFLCVAQVLDLQGRNRRTLFRVVSVVATTLWVIVVVLSINRFEVLG